MNAVSSPTAEELAYSKSINEKAIEIVKSLNGMAYYSTQQVLQQVQQMVQANSILQVQEPSSLITL